MNASELHELVRDVPEVWPEGLEYVEFGNDQYWSLHPGTTTAEAADLILAGVVRKLGDICGTINFKNAWDMEANVRTFWMVVEPFHEQFEERTGGYPSELHAAVAAYLKVKR
jgi:hypothetical protein